MKTFLLMISLFACSFSFASHCLPSTEHPREFKKTLDIIGDSLMISLNGAKLRCLMKDYGFKMDFVGAFLDPFGYRHDGHDADTTVDVMKRLYLIPKSDFYFLLIGVNDILLNLSPEKTFFNIEKIAASLYEKNHGATIYVSTLLPTTVEPLKVRNEKVNSLLRNNLNCMNCQLIDVGDMFSKNDWPGLTVDGIHPTLNGYYIIIEYILSIIRDDTVI